MAGRPVVEGRLEAGKYDGMGWLVVGMFVVERFGGTHVVVECCRSVAVGRVGVVKVRHMGVGEVAYI